MGQVTTPLNGQLELNHCLALALSDYRENQQCLSEPEWVLHSPYGVERRGRLRCLKNRAVMAEVASPFAGLPFRSYYHLVITTDAADPFSNKDCAQVCPELFHPDYPFQNCWKQLRTQFGWTSWEKIKTVVEELQHGAEAKSPSLFLPTYNSNRRNFKAAMDSSVADEAAGASVPPEEQSEDGMLTGESLGLTAPLDSGARRGAMLIYAPAINPNSFVHFSWFNDSCALRDYSKGPTIMPLEDRSRRTSEVRSLIVKQISIRNRQPIADTRYWHETTMSLNKSELASAGSAAIRGAAATTGS